MAKNQVAKFVKRGRISKVEGEGWIFPGQRKPPYPSCAADVERKMKRPSGTHKRQSQCNEGEYEWRIQVETKVEGWNHDIQRMARGFETRRQEEEHRQASGGGKEGEQSKNGCGREIETETEDEYHKKTVI